MTTYPNVRCDRHPDPPAPGYCVCVHVLEQRAPIAYFTPADFRNLGQVLCAACDAQGDAAGPDLRLICTRCVDELLAQRAPRP